MYCGHPDTIIWSSLSRVPSEIPSQERSPVFLLLPSLGDPGPVDPETVGKDVRVALGGSNWSLHSGHKGPNGASWSHVPGISWAFQTVSVRSSERFAPGLLGWHHAPECLEGFSPKSAARDRTSCYPQCPGPISYPPVGHPFPLSTALSSSASR
jgi:hypothetical protein